MENDAKCGEIRTLGILKEFHHLYEDKLNKIGDGCQCTSSQIKMEMLQDWVRDLTEQNTLLVEVVEELEHEASERVTLLEERLRNSSNTSYEIMKTLQDYDVQNMTDQNDILRRMMYFQSDINNLTEFIRRIRDEGLWSTEGLHFYGVSHEDLCGEVLTNARSLSKERELEGSITKLKLELTKVKQQQDDFARDTEQKDTLIEEQSDQIEKLNNVVAKCATSMPDSQRLVEELHDQLKMKSEEYTKLEMLEDNDDKDNDEMKRKIDELEKENKDLHKTMLTAKNELNILHELVDNYNREQHETITGLKCKLKKQLSLNKLITAHETGDNVCSAQNDTTISCVDNEMLRAVYILQTDVNTIISLRDSEDMVQLKKQVEDLENTLTDVENTELLIKNKDEMIRIQNDTLNVAQRELTELRMNLAEAEQERDTRIQEVRNLQQSLKLNQSTVEELERALTNSEEKTNNMQQAADLYVDTIHLLESAKHKAEVEIEQQRVTIGNLQDVLVSTKHQLDEVQGRGASELKEKSDIIYVLYQDLSEMQNQYMDCYSEIVKLTQIADCLRNANLDLKVTNVNLIQDTEELHEKLVYYKENVHSLEESIAKVLYTNESLENTISYLKGELADLARDLQVLQEILKITSTDYKNVALSNSLVTLQEHNESLLEQLKRTQTQVTREIKLNESSSSKIEELQKLLDIKTKELQQYESGLLQSKSKLDTSVRQCREYESKVKAMEAQIEENQKQQKLNDQKTETLLSTYISDLISMKKKVERLDEMLTEKSDELLQLHTETSIKSDKISHLITENQNLKEQSTEELGKLNQNITNLEEHINIYKIRCSEIHEKYKKCKAELESVRQSETKLKEDCMRDRSVLSEKIDSCHNEEIKLNSILANLKAEMELSKASLSEKDEQLKHLSTAQEEIIYLKEEINKITRIRNRILTENQKLQEQITKLNINVGQFETRNKHISQQLEKCLQELNTLQFAKDKLEEKNTQLESDIEQLQRTYDELNQEIRYKNESVINLEQELTETKCSRDEMCAESKIVVNNVRSWLQEQSRAKDSFISTIREKNIIIDELNLERNLLLKNIKEVSDRYNVMLEELQMYKQYLTRMDDDKCKRYRSASPMKRSVHNWGSQGSMSCDSPISPIFTDDFNINYEVDSETEPGPTAWIRKVQNMSEELQKSNNYWKTRLGMSKKLKPVKDIKIDSP
ncbi:hypothetical protein CBL_05608 [Carabus blaptoides fortunei]